MKFLPNNSTQIKKRGFTLIEALVSLGIFSIVVVAATGVILSVISSNKKNQAISSVVNNLNYSIDSMVRDIKTGYKYQCNFDLITGNNLTLASFKLLAPTCSDEDAGTNVVAIMLISTISGKEQIVKYELITVTEGSYIKKTLYNEDSSGVVTVVAYPLTDIRNITINKFSLNVRTPHPLIPTPDPSLGETLGQPAVFLILTGTAKVNQINISDFFIQTYISQRLPNFI